MSLCNTLSPAGIPRGDIPQGTKLALILFAVLVNKLISNWNLKAKYVDDLTIVEIIQRCSFNMLPIIANEIGTFAMEHGMRLNGPRCKDMLIEFLRCKPFSTRPIFINGVPIEQVSTHKILGVYIASDLSWNYHCEYIVKRARRRLYALRVLVKSGLSSQEVLQVYCSLVRSVLEYSSLVWAGFPDYLSDLIEFVQREAMRIILPNLSYDQALVCSGLQTLL